MNGQRDKRFALPGDEEWRPHENKDAELREHNGPPSRSTVKCPNPGCGSNLTIPAGFAGKKGSCPRCGTAVVCPSSTSAPANIEQSRENGSARRPAENVSQSEPPKESAHRASGPATMRAGCIGRGNAGKTALFRALTDGPVGDFLPSGLHVDAGDPREVAQMIRESEQTQKLLHLAGLPPTLIASQIRYYLYEGAEQRAAYCMHEVIGQILTHTLPDSVAEQQTHYDQYLLNLVNTEVVWAVIPCPPRNPSSRERRRYANDLRITMAYLREALRLRSVEQPVAVALVLSKIDTLFESAEEAQSALTNQVLYQALGPLVDLIETSDRVSEAAIVPVTAFGFGNAIVQEVGSRREGTAPETADEPFSSEPVWILREGADALSYNLNALFVWTLLNGLRGQSATDAEEQDNDSRRICKMLEDDLNAIDPWILPLKQGLGARKDSGSAGRFSSRGSVGREQRIA